ncbi:MAG: ATP-binding protein [Parachlamydiaceae bacterium]|nr:ATP-binding protein [Parachlamydiaceae bacterium]
MKRLMDWHLIQWKDNPHRKPLLIRGARQVGKTYGVRQFGKSFQNIVEINFERKKDANKIFEKDLVPERIVQELSLFSGQSIIPGKTLLFFDEIQECPEAIRSMRYFFEEMPLLHVIAAGSLLDFALEKTGLPVGRISSLYVFPLSFMEFLVAIGETLIAEAVLSHEKNIPMGEAIHSKLLDLVGQYLSIGGMPEAVAKWILTKSPLESFKVHHQLIDTYRQDFQKYAKKHEIKYLDALFNEIPRHIGRQFKYSEIHGEYKKRELAPCLDLLCLANVVHKIHYSAGNGLPLGAETNSEWFKIIFLDTALCQAILGLDLATWFLDSRQAFVNRGEIVEAFIGQELLCYSIPYRRTDLYFWKAESPNQAEVDYLYDYINTIIPIEAKSGDGRTLKSMHRFLDQRANSPFGVRFSAQNYSMFQKIDSRPLYATISLANEEQKESLKSLF